MIYLFLGLVAFLCVAFQSTFFSGHLLQYFRPDCVLAVIIYSSFHLSRLPGLFFAFLLGCLADTLSGTPDGWNAFFMVFVYTLAQWLRSQIFTKGIWTRIITVLLFASLKGPCFLLVMKATGHPFSFSERMLLHWIGEAIPTILVTVLLFQLMHGIEDKIISFPLGKQKHLAP